MHLHVLNIIRMRAGCRHLGGGSMCEAGLWAAGVGGLTLQGACPFPPVSCYCVCIACGGLGCSWEAKLRAGEASLAARNHVICPGSCRSLGKTVNIHLRNGVCVRMNPSGLSDHLQTIKLILYWGQGQKQLQLRPRLGPNAICLFEVKVSVTQAILELTVQIRLALNWWICLLQAPE